MKGGSWNWIVTESIVFPRSFLIPTNTITRHIPPSEVNCGFTYIGVLFNFLTLKSEVFELLREHKVGIQVYVNKELNIHNYKFIQDWLSTNGFLVHDKSQPKETRLPTCYFHFQILIQTTKKVDIVPVTHKLKLSIKRHKRKNLMRLPRPKTNARMEPHII